MRRQGVCRRFQRRKKRHPLETVFALKVTEDSARDGFEKVCVLQTKTGRAQLVVSESIERCSQVSKGGRGTGKGAGELGREELSAGPSDYW